MPGAISDNIATPASIDYAKLKVAIIDVRTGDEVMRWPLHDCGNGVYNATAFEQCEYNAQPPAPTASAPSYIYHNTGVVGAVTAAQTTAAKAVFYNSTLNDYRKCSDVCQQYTVNLCGDGIQSNGPLNTDGREECDDGNTVSGDGCSSTCKIEYGYACPIWGALCNLKCGNGVIDAPYEIAAGVWRTETCDLGDSRTTPAGKNTNSGNDYQNACSSTCQVRGT